MNISHSTARASALVRSVSASVMVPVEVLKDCNSAFVCVNAAFLHLSLCLHERIPTFKCFLSFAVSSCDGAWCCFAAVPSDIDAAGTVAAAAVFAAAVVVAVVAAAGAARS